jgi:hypothetical protein
LVKGQKIEGSVAPSQVASDPTGSHGPDEAEFHPNFLKQLGPARDNDFDAG